jgi:hypothetical protein
MSLPDALHCHAIDETATPSAPMPNNARTEPQPARPCCLHQIPIYGHLSSERPSHASANPTIAQPLRTIRIRFIPSRSRFVRAWVSDIIPAELSRSRSTPSTVSEALSITRSDATALGVFLLHRALDWSSYRLFSASWLWSGGTRDVTMSAKYRHCLSAIGDRLSDIERPQKVSSRSGARLCVGIGQIPTRADRVNQMLKLSRSGKRIPKFG